MKGDFSRNTFHPEKSFTRVLMQQGRVQIDADWNEQVSILLHYLRTLASDLIGDHGGPAGQFEITSLTSDDFQITGGHYYVKGLLCENPASTTYRELPEWRRPGNVTFLTPGTATPNYYIVYLDVWERHINHVVDDQIREKALGGPDTCTRSKLVWQIRGVKTLVSDPATLTYVDFLGMISQTLGAGTLSASTRAVTAEDSSPCNISPTSRYRGAENQLYRVEIHSEKDPVDSQITATWKWSRDNGIVVLPIRRLESDGKTTVASVEHLGRDDRFGLKAGDWVEIVDDDSELLGLADGLLKVKEVRVSDLQVIIEGSTTSAEIGRDIARHPLLRRWDQKQTSRTRVTDDGLIKVEANKWLELEDGISVQFQGSDYRTGDYWLIPARVSTGDIEWQTDSSGAPVPLAPQGMQHYYAPLSHIAVNPAGVLTPASLRRVIKLIADP